MNLYIVRHAHADSGSPDSARKLTDYGRNKLAQTIPAWQFYIPKIDLILSSPYKRAFETAEIIHNNFNVSEAINQDKSLQPGINIPDVIITISSYAKENIMIVAHMPDVSDLVSELVSPVSFGYPFSPGTLAAIEFKGEIKAGGGKLKLLMPLKK